MVAGIRGRNLRQAQEAASFLRSAASSIQTEHERMESFVVGTLSRMSDAGADADALVRAAVAASSELAARNPEPASSSSKLLIRAIGTGVLDEGVLDALRVALEEDGARAGSAFSLLAQLIEACVQASNGSLASYCTGIVRLAECGSLDLVDSSPQACRLSGALVLAGAVLTVPTGSQGSHARVMGLPLLSGSESSDDSGEEDSDDEGDGAADAPPFGAAFGTALVAPASPVAHVAAASAGTLVLNRHAIGLARLGQTADTWTELAAMCGALFQLSQEPPPDGWDEVEGCEELCALAAAVARERLGRCALVWLRAVAESPAGLDLAGKRSEAAASLVRLGLDAEAVRAALRRPAGAAPQVGADPSKRAREEGDGYDSLDDARQEDEDSDGNLAGFVVNDDDEDEDDEDDHEEDDNEEDEDDNVARRKSKRNKGSSEGVKRKRRLRRHRASSGASLSEANDAGTSGALLTEGAVPSPRPPEPRAETTPKEKKQKKMKKKHKKHKRSKGQAKESSKHAAAISSE